MLIRPPVVREMRHNLWVQMSATPGSRHVQPGAAPQEESETDVRLGRLKTLGELRSTGVLTDAEFEHEKAKILA
jgi:hypothetical protein